MSVASDHARDLRQLADWVEAHEDIVTEKYQCYAQVALPQWNMEDFQAAAAKFGAGNKYDEYGSIGLRREFGSNRVTAEVSIPKTQSCERRQVGTTTVIKTVPATDIPDGAIVTGATSTVVTVEIEEPEYEWDCPTSFLAS